METIIDIFLFLILLGLAFSIGNIVEKKHYQDITLREQQLLHLPAVSSRRLENSEDILETQMVMGNVVVSLDYFKRILAGLRNFLGGRIISYEGLLDRARREAILRMKEKAQSFQADLILNMRLETVNIAQLSSASTVGGYEILAYGTAVKLQKS